MNITKALHNVHDIHSFFSWSLHNLEICFLIILSLHNVCKALFHYLRPGSGYCRNLFLVAVISSKGLLKLYVSDFVCFGVFLQLMPLVPFRPIKILDANSLTFKTFIIFATCTLMHQKPLICSWHMFFC